MIEVWRRNLLDQRHKDHNQGYPPQSMLKDSYKLRLIDVSKLSCDPWNHYLIYQQKQKVIELGTGLKRD